MSASRAALIAAVEGSPRLRRALAPGERGPFVVGGRPDGWAAAAEAIAAAGGDVVAFHDLRMRARRLWFRRRPVVLGKRLGPLARWSLVFAGTPTKLWFNRGFRALERCVWHLPPSGWRAGRPSPDLMSAHGDALAEVFAALADEPSRRVYASLIRGRMEACSDYFRVSPYREYHHPVVRARAGDVVIDAGAYDGNTARSFAWHMRGRGTIVALEPSPDNFARLRRRWIPGLIPMCLGAWNGDDVLCFEEGRASGRLRSDGATKVRVAPIDRIVRDLRLPRVDLLKLDVEGAEREALEGARATLRRHRPKLQISIYHRRRDLFELPLWLRSTLDGYRLYVGHHNFYHTETDLYAVPRERHSG